jgi:DnaJ family protein C protein 13
VPQTNLFLVDQVGEVALSILHSMVNVHSDLDDAGELVTPTPRVKRILSSSRCLPHIAQVTIFSFYMVHDRA